MDICGELHGVPHHQRFLIVAYNLYSKWPEVVSAGSVPTRTVIDFLETLFTRWGMPSAVTTDNGHIHTAFYNPQANGGVECLNQTLKNSIRVHLADGFQFSTALQRTLLHNRATQHSTTEGSPARLMLGWELSLPLDRLRAPTQPTSSEQQGVHRQSSDQLCDRVTAQQHRMKQRFDRSHRAKPPAFTTLDWVRVRRPTRGHKLMSFLSDPLQMTEPLGPATFRLSDGTRWHARRLRGASTYHRRPGGQGEL